MLRFNVEVITPAVAAEYLKHNESNRRVNKAQVGFYARMMKNGEWTVNGECIKFAPNGRLLDGQHRLMACVEADVSFETAVAREVEENVFATLDQGHLRRRGDVFFLENIPNYTNIAAAINKYLVMGVSQITSMEAASAGPNTASISEGKRKMSAQECLSEYHARPDYWQELLKLAGSMYWRYKFLKQSDIVSIIAHLNLHRNHKLAFVVEFFNQIYHEETTKLNVIRLLRRKLSNSNEKTATTRLTSQAKTQLVRKAWEFYKVGKDTNILKWVKGVEPEKPFE